MYAAEQMTIGGSWSKIVTVKVHDALFFEASVAVHRIEVSPTDSAEPDMGEQELVKPAALSLTLTLNVSTLVLSPVGNLFE